MEALRVILLTLLTLAIPVWAWITYLTCIQAFGAWPEPGTSEFISVWAFMIVPPLVGVMAINLFFSLIRKVFS